jgi:hypothetical protein
MTQPCRWGKGGLGPFYGRVRFHRRFHWPGTLDYYERLWLQFAGADYFARVWLNGQELGSHVGPFDPFEFDVTPLVQLRNDLVVEVELPRTPPDAQHLFRRPEPGGGLWGPVALEVRRETILRNIRIWAEFDGPRNILKVTGDVVGPANHPLELYILLDRATILYQHVNASPVGCPFHVALEVKDVEPWRPGAQHNPRLYEVTVDLIDGAARLASVVLPFGFRRIKDAGRLLRNKSDEPLEVAFEGENAGSGAIACPQCATCSPRIIELTTPVLELTCLRELDERGDSSILCLPLQGPVLDEPAVRDAFAQQIRAIVMHLMHHPALVGWLLHGRSPASNVAFDQSLYEAITSVDPTRPCFVSVV